MAERLEDETYFCWKVAQTNNRVAQVGARGEKCEWDEGTINEAADHGTEMVVLRCNECPMSERRVHLLPKTVISSASNTYEEAKAVIENCRMGG